MEEQGMEAVVTALTTGLSAANLWGQVALVIPLVLVVTLFALGVRIVNKNLNKGAKAKAGKVG